MGNDGEGGMTFRLLDEVPRLHRLNPPGQSQREKVKSRMSFEAELQTWNYSEPSVGDRIAMIDINCVPLTVQILGVVGHPDKTYPSGQSERAQSLEGIFPIVRIRAMDMNY